MLLTENLLRENVLQRNNRNLVRQVIICKDGTKKAIFHKKHFNQPQFLDRSEFWHAQNRAPKENSKRQLRLLEERIKATQG